eukprot:363931-Chlamydomonas_euryale.AAC.13
MSPSPSAQRDRRLRRACTHLQERKTCCKLPQIAANCPKRCACMRGRHSRVTMHAGTPLPRHHAYAVAHVYLNPRIPCNVERALNSVPLVSQTGSTQYRLTACARGSSHVTSTTDTLSCGSNEAWFGQPPRYLQAAVADVGTVKRVERGESKFALPTPQPQPASLLNAPGVWAGTTP